MSAIGDYIHYTLYGYERQGVKHTPYLSDADTSCKRVHEYIMRTLQNMNDRKTAEEIQTLLNQVVNLYGSHNTAIGNQVKIYEDAWKAYYKAAEKGIADLIGSTVLEVVKDGASKGQVVNSQGKQLIKPTRVAEGGKYIKIKTSVNTLDKLYNDINNKLKLMANQKLISKEAIIFYETTLKEISGDLENIRTIANAVQKDWLEITNGKIRLPASESNQQKEIIVLLRKQFNPDPNQKITRADRLKYGGVVDKLNALAASLNASAYFIKAVGESLEQGVPAALNYLSQHLTEFAGDSILKTMVAAKKVGDNTSQRAYRDKLFYANISMKEVVKGDSSTTPKVVQQGDENYTVTANFEVKNKADLEIIYKSGQPTYVSLKNFNNKISKNEGIHIVTGSPLLYILQSYNQDDFVNHYLNYAFAMRGTKRNQDVTAINALKPLMHKTLSEVILLNALTQAGAVTVGGNIKGYPGLFLFRETYPTSESGMFADQFRVITMYDLFEILMKNPDAYIDFGKAFDQVSGRLDLASYLGKFGRPSRYGYDTMSDKRISWILTQVHRQKISVKITRQAVVNKLQNPIQAKP